MKNREKLVFGKVQKKSFEKRSIEWEIGLTPHIAASSSRRNLQLYLLLHLSDNAMQVLSSQSYSSSRQAGSKREKWEIVKFPNGRGQSDPAQSFHFQAALNQLFETWIEIMRFIFYSIRAIRHSLDQELFQCLKKETKYQSFLGHTDPGNLLTLSLIGCHELLNNSGFFSPEMAELSEPRISQCHFSDTRYSVWM